MISICFKVIAALIFCVTLVSAQTSFLAEKSSRTQTDHVIQEFEFAKSKGADTISKYDDMTAVTTASLSYMEGVPIDQSGRILASGLEQFIVTVAGTGSDGFSGDNGAATSAQISKVGGLNVDGKGDNYFADYENNRIRKVTASTGIITTIAGTGSPGYSGDNGAATSAQLNSVYGVAVAASGDVYIADSYNSCIRKVTVSTGIITTIAGIGNYEQKPTYGGDNGAATSAQLSICVGVALDASGNVYIADTTNSRIRKVTVSTGIINTIAGTGTNAYGGDNGAAASAQLYYPFGVAVDASGNVYIADTYNFRIRKVTASTGIITTIAGTGTNAYSGDNGYAINAQISYIYGVAIDGMDNVYIADNGINRIRKVTVSTGIITRIAGTGSAAYSGDNGAATSAQLNGPFGVAVDASGNVYIADSNNYRIRQLTSAPTSSPTAAPSVSPTASPSAAPSVSPTACPSAAPSVSPTACPSGAPSMTPTASPSAAPSMSPTACPSGAPSMTPTACPSTAPSVSPTACPSTAPSVSLSSAPSSHRSKTPKPTPAHHKQSPF